MRDKSTAISAVAALCALVLCIPTLTACSPTQSQKRELAFKISAAATYLFDMTIPRSYVSVLNYEYRGGHTVKATLKIPDELLEDWRFIQVGRAEEAKMRKRGNRLPLWVGLEDTCSTYLVDIFNALDLREQFSNTFENNIAYTSQVLTPISDLINSISFAISPNSPLGTKQVYKDLEKLTYSTLSGRTTWLNTRSIPEDFSYTINVTLNRGHEAGEFVDQAENYLHFDTLPDHFNLNLITCLEDCLAADSPQPAEQLYQAQNGHLSLIGEDDQPDLNQYQNLRPYQDPVCSAAQTDL